MFLLLIVEWLKDHEKEAILPGLTQFTPQQLFWISSAQYKCSKLTDEELREQIRSSEYAPWAMRNNGTAMSTPEFSKDFKCLQGSPMNPEWKSIEGCAYRGLNFFKLLFRRKKICLCFKFF